MPEAVCRNLIGIVWLVMGLTAHVALARGPDVAPKEFEIYSDWKSGREDPRLEKHSDAVKLKKIARSLGMKPKDLQAVVDKVEPLAATLKAETEKGIRDSLGTTPLKDRVLSVELNLDTGIAVAWVKWRCGDLRDTDQEAALVAWGVADGGPVVKILGLWCVNKIETKLFSAKIGRPAFERISRPSIERFASSRYIRLFEEVKRGPHR